MKPWPTNVLPFAPSDHQAVTSSEHLLAENPAPRAPRRLRRWRAAPPLTPGLRRASGRDRFEGSNRPKTVRCEEDGRRRKRSRWVITKWAPERCPRSSDVTAKCFRRTIALERQQCGHGGPGRHLGQARASCCQSRPVITKRSRWMSTWTARRPGVAALQGLEVNPGRSRCRRRLGAARGRWF